MLPKEEVDEHPEISEFISLSTEGLEVLEFKMGSPYIQCILPEHALLEYQTEIATGDYYFELIWYEKWCDSKARFLRMNISAQDNLMCC